MIDKLFVSFFVALMIISAILALNSMHYYAFALYTTAVLLMFLHYIRTLIIIRSQLFFLGLSKHASSKQLLAAATRTIFEQKEVAQLVIQEIEKIGQNKSDQLPEKIDHKAALALTRLKNRVDLYKKEEVTRNWSVEGMASLNDIRKTINSTEDFANKVIAYLVNYLNANQGAFYLIRDEEGDNPVLELTASYAYGKRKYTDERITVSTGKGLLGQCVQERDIIFLRQVPKDYVRITSGLGEATPTCILITPLIFGERVYGAIELASFHILAEYQLDFARKVSVNIAAEVSAMIIHENTERLLDQTMQAQEQMTKNELQIRAKLLEVEAERSKNIAILNGCMDGVISFNEAGIIGFANAAAEAIFNRSQYLLLGSDIRNLIGVTIVENRKGENSIVSSIGNEITVRTEVTVSEHDLSLLLTATKVQMNEGYLFTLFIQKISADLF